MQSVEVDDRPHQHVNEDDDGKEDSSAAGVYAEKQDEVAKEAQDISPTSCAAQRTRTTRTGRPPASSDASHDMRHLSKERQH